MKHFSNDIIKFEAITKTPLKESLVDVSLDKQLEVADEVFADVERFARERNQDLSRNTWTEFCKQADWTRFKPKSFLSKLFS